MHFNRLLLAVFAVLCLPGMTVAILGLKSYLAWLCGWFAGKLLLNVATGGYAGYLKLGLVAAEATINAGWDIYDHCHTNDGSAVDKGDCAFSVLSNCVGMILAVLAGSGTSFWTKRELHSERMEGLHAEITNLWDRSGVQYEVIKDHRLVKRDADSGIADEYNKLIYKVDNNIASTIIITNGTHATVKPLSFSANSTLEKRDGFNGYDLSEGSGGLSVQHVKYDKLTDWNSALGWAQYTPSGKNAPWWNLWQLTSGSHDRVAITAWDVGGSSACEVVGAIKVQTAGFGQQTELDWIPHAITIADGASDAGVMTEEI